MYSARRKEDTAQSAKKLREQMEKIKADMAKEKKNKAGDSLKTVSGVYILTFVIINILLQLEQNRRREWHIAKRGWANPIWRINVCRHFTR